MKPKNRKNQAVDPLRGFRKTGAITFEGIVYDLMLSRNGEIAFARDGKWIEDQTLQNQLMDYLLEANKEIKS